jgi:hypothetical protein
MVALVPCRCAPQSYYQHNASYTIQFSGKTYFIIGNITYQGLFTCQALIAPNPRHDSRGLITGNNLTVPVRCACPSPSQATAGVRYLLAAYLVTWGDSGPVLRFMGPRAKSRIRALYSLFNYL